MDEDVKEVFSDGVYCERIKEECRQSIDYLVRESEFTSENFPELMNLTGNMIYIKELAEKYGDSVKIPLEMLEELRKYAKSKLTEKFYFDLINKVGIPDTSVYALKPKR